MIAIVDTGGANLASITNALSRLEYPALVTVDPEIIRDSHHVILPGVGSAASIMARIMQLNLTDCIRTLKQPTLGICLGMQLLFERSEEGDTPCLGLIPGVVRLLPRRSDLPVPHMGWNQLRFEKSNGRLFKGLPEDAHAYFVHSYAAGIDANVTASFDYGDRYAAAVEKDNFFGVQFHPERSAHAGAQLLRNFLQL